MAKNILTKDERELLIKLYEYTFKDEGEHIQLEQKTLTLFSGMILAVIGGAILVTKDIPDAYFKFSSLLISGFVVIVLSYLAVQAFKSNYRRHLEAIASRAKLEDLLDLADTDKYSGNRYWQQESLILKRHLEDRKTYKDSREFVSDRVNKGFISVVKAVFIMFSLIGIILICMSVYQLVH